jgi:hypothetical protein
MAKNGDRTVAADRDRRPLGLRHLPHLSLTMKQPKPQTRRWRIVLARAKGVTLGTVEAASPKEAVEIGAKEFDYPAWRLIAEPME